MDKYMAKIFSFEEQMKLMLKVWADYFGGQLLQQSEDFQKQMKTLEDKVKSQEAELENQQILIAEQRSHHQEQERRIYELRNTSKEQQQSLGSLVKHIDCHYKCIKSLKQNLKHGSEGEIHVIPPSHPPIKRRKTDNYIKT